MQRKYRYVLLIYRCYIERFSWCQLFYLGLMLMSLTREFSRTSWDDYRYFFFFLQRIDNFSQLFISLHRKAMWIKVVPFISRHSVNQSVSQKCRWCLNLAIAILDLSKNMCGEDVFFFYHLYRNLTVNFSQIVKCYGSVF